MAAPFISIGYDGSVDEIAWATLAPNAGGVYYGVLDETSWVAAVVPNADRQLTISPGTGTGKGVTDITDQPVTLPTFDTQSAGTRYDLVVARRTWATNTTTFAIVKGGSSRALPGRNVGAGAVDDQPLWLVPVVANGAGGALGAPIDLRVMQGDGGATARDDLVLTYLNRVGTAVRIGDTLWQRTLGTNGAPTWIRSSMTSVPLLGMGFALSNLPGADQAPPATADIKMQTGTFRGVTDGVAYMRLTFPVPFPNGLLSIVCMSADDNALNGVTFAVAGTVSPGHPWGFGNREWVVLRVWGPVDGGAGHYILPNRAVRANYVAFGW